MSTGRIERLRARLMDEMAKRVEWTDKGSSIITSGRVAALPVVLRKAMAVAQTLMVMPVEIGEDELIVGKIALGSTGLGHNFPEYTTSDERAGAASAGWSAGSVWGHYAPNHGRLLEEGLRGVRQEVTERTSSLKRDDVEREDKGQFYRAVIVCLNAVRAFAGRYAALAARMAEEEEDPARRRELEEIARICGKVPEEPAGSFHEALQSFWFLHSALHSTMNLVPVGRFDQFVYPYLERDLSDGRISPEQAQELLECLWIKFNERTRLSAADFEDRRDPVRLRRDKEENLIFRNVNVNNWLQNVMLGGQTPAGGDASNRLTLMCMEAARRLELTNPVISLRLWEGTPEEVVRQACVLMQAGGGVPAIFNDAVFMPGLIEAGIPPEDARDYSNDGCWETLIPGKTEFRFQLIDALKCLELALNRGYCLLTGSKVGVETGDPLTFTTFGDVKAAFRLQLEEQLIRFYAARHRFHDGSLARIAPVPLLSAFLHDCLERGRDITRGGARYFIFSPILHGVPNAADALAAIRVLVFETGRVGWSELLDALRTDFSGREALRLLLLNRAPKYGNDIEEVDKEASEILSLFADTVTVLAGNSAGAIITFGVGTFEQFVYLGRRSGASADGRRSRAPVSCNLSPSPGAAGEGPTAAIRSYTRLPVGRMSCGSPLDLVLSTGFVGGAPGLDRLVALVRAFVELGGNILTVTVADVDTLREAQRSPEQHRNLRVRVGGWQAYFVALDREHQEHVIARAERGE